MRTVADRYSETFSKIKKGISKILIDALSKRTPRYCYSSGSVRWSLVEKDIQNVINEHFCELLADFIINGESESVDVPVGFVE